MFGMLGTLGMWGMLQNCHVFFFFFFLNSKLMVIDCMTRDSRC